jgi:tRNA(Ile)-lysidine synthase
MPHQPRSANRLSEHIRAAVRRTARASGATRLIVACSGGADSVCLAHAAAHVAREQRWSLVIAHIQHGVRPDDAADAAHVAALADAFGVPFEARRLAFGMDGPPINNIEATLRAARYAALAEIAAVHDAQAILTGHTLDDQAETVLLNLLRGAARDGLAGIAERGEIAIANPSRPIGLLRPLLTIRRDETHAYCAMHALTFVHDATNDDDRFTRNWLRHQVFPVLTERFPAATQTVARVATIMHDDAAYLAAQTDEAYRRCLRPSLIGTVAFDARTVHETPVAIQRRILRRILGQFGVPERFDLVEAFVAVAHSGSSRISSVGGIACCLVYGQLVIGDREAVERHIEVRTLARHPLVDREYGITEGVPVSLSDCGKPEWFTLEVFRSTHPEPSMHGRAPKHRTYLSLPAHASLRLRPPHPGDRWRARGAAHSLPLKEYFARQGIPVSVRDRVPLLVAGDAICWVIGYDTASLFAADAATATHVAVLSSSGDERGSAPGEAGER